MADRTIANKRGEKEPFRREKLYRSVRNPALEADYGEDEADELASEIVEEIIAWMDDHDDQTITVRELEEEVTHRLADRAKEVAFLYETHLDIN